MAEEKKEVKDEVKDSEESIKPKKSRLKLVVLTGIVLILGIGGYFAWSMFIKPTKKETVKKEEMNIIFPLKSFIVNLMDKKGLGKRYLKVTMEIEVNDEEHRKMAERYKPQLRDTILLLLSSQILQDINTMEGKLELKQLLLSRMNRVTGEGIIQRVYFTEFVVQ